MFVDILEFLLGQVVKSSQKENAFQIMKYTQMEENNALYKMNIRKKFEHYDKIVSSFKSMKYLNI